MSATPADPIVENAGPDTPEIKGVDPVAQFNAWLAEAVQRGVPEPQAMSLATVDRGGWPSVRIVQLKRADKRGFEFYTNLHSAKGVDLAANPRAALGFFWPSLGRQVRVTGPVIAVTDAEADAAFAVRPRLLQIGTWASRQSQPMPGRLDLEQACAALAVRYALGCVPRPDFWSGFRVLPERIEFMRQLQLGRVERMRYTAADGRWHEQRLYP